ncbi:hypothetical protein VE25_07300 [Devosia geojensis]|uniref:Uncharacterized protein n=1 Tax=Devosia geojensis TaxID=443610 RepID=A0A0F5FU53_9HYPH|nr:hypothetical protein [Devosia geojensis]KKB12358.1 hypothetical protein VE25_07300 [Devosia geojensis]
MVTSIITAVAQNVILGWLWRRVQELAGLALTLVPIYLAMPPSMQADVHAIFSGQGGNLTISAAIGLAWYLWTQWKSYRATVMPQVVTTDARKVPLPAAGEGSGTTRKIEALAEAAPRPRTLWERLTQR